MTLAALGLPDPGTPLAPEQATAAFRALLSADLPDAEIAAFLLALAERGETADEIAAAAEVMRSLMQRVSAPDDAIDICGTGGDGSHSLNVSTAATFVVAAAGVPVAKHGNRGASSRSGTADVLEQLGWRGDLPLDRVEACLHETGVTFLFAQRHHPALARLAPIRRALGRRTIFNLLGPLANPAGVRRQLIGVAAPVWLDPIATAALALGAQDVLTAHGGGLDEVAVHGTTDLRRGTAGALVAEQFDPVARGLGLFARDAIAGGAPQENAAALKDLFAGSGRPAYRAIVLANAAAALTLAGRSWPQAIADATDALDTGAAADRLARFLAFR